MDLEIPESEQMKMSENQRLVFFLKKDSFLNCKAQHEICIGTSFVKHSEREYKIEASKDTRWRDSRIGHVAISYVCQRRGKPPVVKNRVPGASFIAVLQPAGSIGNGQEGSIYRIEYKLDHNHNLSKDNTIATLQKSKSIKDRIKTMLLQGMAIRTITDRLTMDYAKFSRLMESSSTQGSPGDDTVTYHDVYDILHAITNKEMRKDENESISTRLWMEDLLQNEFFTYCDTKDDQYYGFSSPWQLEQLYKWGDVLCLDGMYQAGETGFGIPCAFLLTKAVPLRTLEGWLVALKDKMRQLFNKEFHPAVVITDQGQTEINAIQVAWPLGTRIFYSAWHVLDAWEGKLTSNYLGSSNLLQAQNRERELKASIRRELRSILYARTVDEADALVKVFQDAWKDLAPHFLQYLNENYLDSEANRRRWMFCYREGVSYGSINTSDFVESWHNIVKELFCKDKHQQRLDTVIYVLVHGVIPHFTQKCLHHKVQVGRLGRSKQAVLEAMKKAVAFMDLKRQDDPLVAFLFPTEDSTVFRVASFQGTSTTYELKHIALATIELPHTEFHCTVEEDFALPLELALEDAMPESAAAESLTPTLLAKRYMQDISNGLARYR
ncbi:hypothetical protein BGZ99_007747 [Dissophora globulifera]|uniref:MULE transposase domain-containing protein n=1 Tax=Dissophora globulifera TaxID=979702 RepID=A0A9P6UQJ8_9FUNG|nr:hypothetical protein BGZ99_007747 [Dissophora globulifera]